MQPRSPVLSAALFGAQHASAHRLPVAALVLSVEGTLSVSAEGFREEASAFVLGTDTRHAGESSGAHLIVLVDNLVGYGRSFASEHRHIHGHLEWLGALQETVVSHSAELTCPQTASALIDDVLATTQRRESWRAPRWDARVEHALEVIEHAACTGTAVPSPVIRGVSPAHLRALFRRDMGVTMSQHARRRRLLVALATIASRGTSATYAATDAGFADAAHLSRTTRSAFGMTLSAIRAEALHAPSISSSA